MRPRSNCQPSLRDLAVWLLAFVVLMQVLTVGWLQAQGPSHSHVRTTDEAILKADFRRQVGSTSRAEAADRWLVERVHGHAHAPTRRHYHAFDDLSARYEDGDRFGGPAGDDRSLKADTAVGFLPVPATALAVLHPSATDVAQPRRLWTPTTGIRMRIERPPILRG